MKKLIIIVVLLNILTSCGPKRLGCGPGRCDIDNSKNKELHLKNIC